MKRGTQKQLSKKTGYTESYISLVLSGKRRPTWDRAKVLSRTTNTKPELWLDGSPEKIREILDAVNF